MAVDLSVIDPSIDAVLARLIYDAFNENFACDITLEYGNKIIFEDSGGTNIEVYASGTDLVFPVTTAQSTADNVATYYGSDSNINMTFDGTKFMILTPVADDVLIEWGDGTESFDHTFFFETANDHVKFNASDKTVTFDGVDLRLDDDDMLQFGDDQDLSMRWDGTDFDILPLADDKCFKIGNGIVSMDVWIYGNTANDNIIFDASENLLQLDGVDLYLEDDDNLSFGDSQDVVMQWAAGGGFNITFAADNSVVTWGATGNSADHIWYGATSAKYVKIDTSEDLLYLEDVDLYLGDNDNISFGDSQDVVIQYASSGAKFTITSAADDESIEVGNGNESLDLKWFFETTSNYIYFDADSDIVYFEAVDLRLNDDDILMFGDSGDVKIAWATAGGLDVTAVADNTVWTWGETGNSFDMLWNLSTTAHFIKIDCSEDTIQFDDVDIYLGDNDNISFGDSQDIVMQYTTKFTITADADDDEIEIGDGTKSIDIEWFGNTASDTVYFDASGNVVTFNGVDLYLDDADELCFGDDQDVTISWEAGGNLVIDALADDQVLEIGNSAATQLSFDVIIYQDAANGADYFKFDAGASTLSWAGASSMSLSTYTHTKITNKTGDYTVLAADTGTIFTTTGTSADVEFTLPTEATGLVYEFYMCEDFELKITSATGNNIIAFNDKAATSLTFTTAGQQIGAWVKVVCNGSVWLMTWAAGGTGNEYTSAVA